MHANLEPTMAERLKERMKEKRLRQIDISKAIGASRGTVSKWLSGDAEPNHEYMLRLAEVLDVHPDWIIEGDNYYATYDDLDAMENALKEENRDRYINDLKLKNNIPYSIRYLEELYHNFCEDRFNEMQQKIQRDYEEDMETFEEWSKEPDDLGYLTENQRKSANFLSNIAKVAGADIYKTIYVTLEDDSMSPMIHRKAECAVDTGKQTIKDGKVYYFKHELIHRIRILHKNPDGGLLIRSKNKEFGEETINTSDISKIKILGWVYSWTNIDTW
ncbi:XRE family transcriptional regulator [Psychrobacter fjordensis]|uniref:XRE family transcriptional regulator n=1 Tax=Psychrobacter fjordensis TaxID=664424 RepID=UPI001918F1EF|nr:XRE family transcriptional regulator [Psychrobacter fjordensis]